MQGDVKERIKAIMNNEKLSGKAFAEKIKIPRSTLVSMFSKDTKPSFDIIESIAVALPSYSLNWLITGQGSMLKASNPSNGINANYNGTFSEPVGLIVGGGHIGNSPPFPMLDPVNNDLGELVNENVKLKLEIERLKMNLELKDEIIKSKDDMIQNKIEIIKTKDEMINFLSKK